MMKRTSFWGVNSRRSCRSSQNRSTSASSALLVRADLDYCDIEWFALKTDRDHSVIFEIASKYYILDSVGEGEDGMIWENGIETCIISYKKRIASPGSMQDTGCLGLVH